ncbi:MAG: hypothetical protein Q8P67_28695 [archaeon]|nr:hypothetical protein [archaeon]
MVRLDIRVLSQAFQGQEARAPPYQHPQQPSRQQMKNTMIMFESLHWEQEMK